jgi:hypothetical protein
MATFVPANIEGMAAGARRAILKIVADSRRLARRAGRCIVAATPDARLR